MDVLGASDASATLATQAHAMRGARGGGSGRHESVPTLAECPHLVTLAELPELGLPVGRAIAGLRRRAAFAVAAFRNALRRPHCIHVHLKLPNERRADDSRDAKGRDRKHLRAESAQMREGATRRGVVCGAASTEAGLRPEGKWSGKLMHLMVTSRGLRPNRAN